jgi:hypothetical protein
VAKSKFTRWPAKPAWSRPVARTTSPSRARPKFCGARSRRTNCARQPTPGAVWRAGFYRASGAAGPADASSGNARTQAQGPSGERRSKLNCGPVPDLPDLRISLGCKVLRDLCGTPWTRRVGARIWTDSDRKAGRRGAAGQGAIDQAGAVHDLRGLRRKPAMAVRAVADDDWRRRPSLRP